MLDLTRSTRAVSAASTVAVRQGLVQRDVPKWAPHAEQLSPKAEALAAAVPTD